MSEKARWESRFAVDHYVFGTAPNAFLARQAGLLRPGLSALSIADGEGRNGVWLAEQGLVVTSQDFSPRAQVKAQALAKERGVELTLVLADILAFDWPEAEYDVIVGIFFQFLSPPDRAEVFAAIQKAVKPGGLILIEGYGLRQLEYGTGGPKIAENLYSPELLEKAFSDCVRVDINAYDAEIDEGPGHSGMSSLVDLVARR